MIVRAAAVLDPIPDSRSPRLGRGPKSARGLGARRLPAHHRRRVDRIRTCPRRARRPLIVGWRACPVPRRQRGPRDQAAQRSADRRRRALKRRSGHSRADERAGGSRTPWTVPDRGRRRRAALAPPGRSGHRLRAGERARSWPGPSSFDRSPGASAVRINAASTSRSCPAGACATIAAAASRADSDLFWLSFQVASASRMLMATGTIWRIMRFIAPALILRWVQGVLGASRRSLAAESASR